MVSSAGRHGLVEVRPPIADMPQSFASLGLAVVGGLVAPADVPHHADVLLEQTGVDVELGVLAHATSTLLVEVVVETVSPYPSPS